PFVLDRPPGVDGKARPWGFAAAQRRAEHLHLAPGARWQARRFYAVGDVEGGGREFEHCGDRASERRALAGGLDLRGVLARQEDGPAHGLDMDLQGRA